MFWWMTREGRWAHRKAVAEWDVAHYRSGVAFYAQKLREAKLKVEAIERSRINVDFPPPRGVVQS